MPAISIGITIQQSWFYQDETLNTRALRTDYDYERARARLSDYSKVVPIAEFFIVKFIYCAKMVAGGRVQ